MNLNILLKKKNFLILLPALLLFIFSSIFWLYSSCWITLGINVNVLPMVFLTIIISYIILYTYLNLEISFISFASFFINIIIFLLYTRGFFYLVKGLSHPIYLSDLSDFAKYRYLILCCISLIGLGLYVLSLKFIKVSQMFAVVYLPFLKEEFRKILYIWNENIFGPLCSTIINRIENFFLPRLLFFFFHFVLFYLTRIIGLGLFVNFVFFKGDMRLLFFWLPISFVVWILSFLDYYFNVFFEGSCTYIQSLLILKFDDKEPDEYYFGLKKVKKIESINISDKAIQEGFPRNKKSVDILFDLWLLYGKTSGYFSLYKSITRVVVGLIILVQIFCWLYITSFFFLPDYHIFAGFPPVSRSLLMREPVRALVSRVYCSEARAVKQQFRAVYEKATEGSGRGDHLAVVDPAVKDPENASRILYEGSLSHGPGSTENPSTSLNPNKDLKGCNREQKLIPPKRTPTYIDEKFFMPNPIPGSVAFLKKNWNSFRRSQPIEEST